MKRTREEEAVIAWVEDEHRKQGTSGDLEHISAGGDGLFTSRKSDRAGAKILSVPLSCMLTAEKAVDSPLGVAFAKFAPNTPPEHILWLFVAQARRWPGNFFHAWMQCLNANAPDPANWPKAERDELRDTILYPILLKVEEDMTALCDVVTQFAKVHPEHHLEGLTVQELLWARGHHRSRRFADSLNPDSRQYGRGTAVTGASQVKENGMGVMIPLLDKTNHNPNTRVSWRVANGEVAFHCEEAVDHKANNGEVFNNYGPKSNEMLLLDFGFALPNNPFDAVSLTLCVGDGKKGVKRLGPFQVRRLSERWQTFPRQLWCALADPLNADPNAGEDEAEQDAAAAAAGGNVDIGIEEIEMLQAQLAHRLKLLSGTEASDRDVDALSGNRRFVALYRNGQREVLREALDELAELAGQGEECEEMMEEGEGEGSDAE